MSNRGAEYNVLFLGSGNCARSVMAEAILNREGRGKFSAYSAGIHAHAVLDQDAIDLLNKLHFDVGALHPKEWSEFAGEHAPAFDFIFTVCDDAALLPRSMWRGNPIFAHWSVPDPARSAGNDAQVRLAYADAFRMLSNRIGVFVNLPLRSLDLMSMQRKLDMIGNPEAAAAIVAA